MGTCSFKTFEGYNIIRILKLDKSELGLQYIILIYKKK